MLMSDIVIFSSPRSLFNMGSWNTADRYNTSSTRSSPKNCAAVVLLLNEPTLENREHYTTHSSHTHTHTHPHTQHHGADKSRVLNFRQLLPDGAFYNEHPRRGINRASQRGCGVRGVAFCGLVRLLSSSSVLANNFTW
jgi:hypothetical protein